MPFEHITAPIRTENIENHESLLEQNILALQFEYVDRIVKKEIPSTLKDPEKLNPLEFQSVLRNFTDLTRSICKRYVDSTGGEWSMENQELQDLCASIFYYIAQEYVADPEGWKTKVPEIIEERFKKIPEGKKPSKRENHSLSAGIISYGVGFFRGLKKDIPFLAEKLMAEGLSDEDKCLAIHFDFAFKKQLANSGENGKIFPQNSLSLVAKNIVEKNSETRAIIGWSWLLDTPIAKAMGFQVSNQLPIDGNMSFWYQFVDKDGQIKKNEVEEFLQTGVPRHYVREGYILVEEFLKKYLPKEKKGAITLKKFAGVSEDDRDENTAQMGTVIMEWDSLSGEQVVKLLSKTRLYGAWVKTDEGKKMLDFVFQSKNEGKSVNEVLECPEFDAFKEEYKKFLDKTKYQDYTVQI